MKHCECVVVSTEDVLSATRNLLRSVALERKRRLCAVAKKYENRRTVLWFFERPPLGKKESIRAAYYEPEGGLTVGKWIWLRYKRQTHSTIYRWRDEPRQG